jgi:hypothetical protein
MLKQTWTWLLFCAIAYAGRTNAQQLINDKIDVLAGSSQYMMNCVIYKPANFSTSQTYPLVLYFHGMVEAGTDINKMYQSGLVKVLNDGYRPSFNFIMVAPQHNSYSLDPDHLEQVLNESIKKFPNIDQSRIYLTGHSAGGNTIYVSTLNINQELPKRFAAMAVMSGATQGINKNNFYWWKNFRTPLWAVVGGSDPSYLSQNEYLVNEVNKQVPGLASLTVRPGITHGGWEDVYRGLVNTSDNKTMWQWLSQFSRSSSGAVVGGGGITTNTPPTANAGTDKAITLPTNSTQLTGSGTDPGGSIASYAWSRISGPTQYSFSNNGIASPTVSNLIQGTYVFRLKVTDNAGATDSDDMTVTVNSSTSGNKAVKVNLYGGAYPYSNGEWNNWNTSSSLSSSALKFSDGTSSTVTARLSGQNSVADNSSSYPITMAPREVGRHASVSSTNRTLTLSGLQNRPYTLEIYASRSGSTTNTTRFSVGSTTVDISTSNNYSRKAIFSFTPVNGTVTVNIARLNSYNYINGFVLQ